MSNAARLREVGPDDDEALVVLARHGDERAVRELVRRHNQRLFRAARSIVRNDGEAEDVVQAAYVRAFRHLDQFRGGARFSTWLTRIAINEATTRLRRRRPTVDVDAVDIATGAGTVIAFPTVRLPVDPEAEMSRTEIRVLLERAIDDLPPIFRTVFVLRDIEGLSVEETAEQLHQKPVTVRTRLHRARQMLRATLEAEIAGSFGGLFPFDGQRCVAMADRVLVALRDAAP